MVNKALVLENHSCTMECKRKQEHLGQGSNNPRPWLGMSSTRPIQRAP
jgi:hypothetical protein